MKFVKKLILTTLLILFVQLSVQANTEVKNYEYYQKQILGQRIPYNVSGLGNSINKGRTDLVEMFMKAGMSPNETFMGLPMTYFAVKNKQLECLNVLLHYGADVEASTVDCDLLTWAIYNGSSDAVEILIKYNVDVNREFKGTLPLNKAISKKQPKITELLINAGAKPNEKTHKLITKSKNEYIKDLVFEKSKTK